MPNDLTITQIDVHEFQWQSKDLGHDYNQFNLVYTPGATMTHTAHLLQIHTDQGITGELLGGGGSEYAQMEMYTHYLLGRNPLKREKFYNDVKRALRKTDRMSVGLVDIALWDIAGKVYNAPVWELLGGYRKTLPAYASTYHGDENGGLDSPEAFADFAEHCYDIGYRAFKIHGWGNGPIDREVENVLEMGRRVGDRMDLMLDPACEYLTFGDALKVGLACDEAGFFWYEDPYHDGGLSIFAQRRLRETIKTPILMGEHVRTLEPKVDMVVAEATDYMRVNPTYDMGITGAMKVAHAAEGFGLDVELHGGGPAQRHCMAAIRNTNYYELGLVHPNCQSSTPPVILNYPETLDAIDKNGHVEVPTAPGLGYEYDWDFIEANRTGLKSYKLE